jgi:hypothetical protein
MKTPAFFDRRKIGMTGKYNKIPVPENWGIFLQENGEGQGKEKREREREIESKREIEVKKIRG